MISIFFFVTYQQQASCDLQADHFSFAVGQKISKTFSRFLIIAQACNTCGGYITHLWYKNANTWYLFATTRHCIIYFIHIMHTIMHSDTDNGRMMSKFQIIFGHNPNPKKYFQKCLKSLVETNRWMNANSRRRRQSEKICPECALKITQNLFGRSTKNFVKPWKKQDISKFIHRLIWKKVMSEIEFHSESY